MELPAFHLALGVADISACLPFYRDLLACELGRRSEHWQDLSLWGHQLVLHQVVQEAGPSGPKSSNHVDGDRVPVPHFGLVLDWTSWEILGDRISASKTPFLIAPRVRFQGLVGEQGTFFLVDPAGHVLEFKAFREPGQLFAT